MQVRKFQNTFRTLALSAACSVALLGNALALDTSDAEGGDCPHIGVETVPGAIGGSGPIIDCDGEVSFQISYEGAGGTLVWKGPDCPTFVQVIPQHDKQVHKMWFRISSTIKFPRKDFYYKCDEGWFDDECVFDKEKDGVPAVEHSYEQPCPGN